MPVHLSRGSDAEGADGSRLNSPAAPVVKRYDGGMKQALLNLRARCGVMWRVGLIKRTTAFRWDVDAALGEYTWK